MQVEFGNVVRLLRNETGISQEDLGFKAGIHRTYIGGIERGERNPSLLNIGKLLNALECSWQRFGSLMDKEVLRK